MRKEEFLEKLRARLSQTMSQQEVTAQTVIMKTIFRNRYKMADQRKKY